MQYTIVLEHCDADRFIARCVEVPGIIGYGNTKGDAIVKIREQIALVQKTRNEELQEIIHEIRSEIIKINVADAA